MALVRMLQEADVELVVLGWVYADFERRHAATLSRIGSSIFIRLCLPKFPGLEAWRQALAAGEEVTGCTVHYVDAGIDSGEIIAQREVPILPNDTAGIPSRTVSRSRNANFIRK